jgi:hypothetical protein
VTVDGSDGDIYVWETSRPSFVDQFNSAGGLIGRLTGYRSVRRGEVRAFNNVLSIAVDPESHDIYEFTTPGPGMHGEATSSVRAESVTYRDPSFLDTRRPSCLDHIQTFMRSVHGGSGCERSRQVR